MSNAHRRIEAFLDAYETMQGQSETILTVGVASGIHRLEVADLRELLSQPSPTNQTKERG